MLTPDEVRATAAWIAGQQEPSGEIPWWRGGKTDPWDHVHAAMGLTIAGFFHEAAAAFRFLARTQLPSGAWPAARENGAITDATQESNHAAYICTGLWHHYCVAKNTELLVELWPTVERAINFTLHMQDESGAISWAVAPAGTVWRAPLLTGSSSIHGSLVCAVRIAEHLGFDRPAWRAARIRLALVLRDYIKRFEAVDLPEAPGRYSMDWYYPVLGGAVRGAAARDRLSSPESIATFITEGVGCRCVRDAPWYTVAESCELVLALNAAGLSERAAELLSWMCSYRMASGAYRTGKTWPENVFWPVESNTWTAATVLMAEDAIAGRSPVCDFFRDLSGTDLGALPPPEHAQGLRRG